MKKKIIIVILMFLVIFISIAKASLLDNILLPFQFLFEIIFPSSPEILEAKIEPIKVEPSDWMIITATVKDKYGIESVKADMAGIEIVELKLISGNENEGIYQTSWFVHSVEVGKTYNATIIARNVKGKESFFVLQFHDDPVFCCRKQINGTGPSNVVSIILDTASLIFQGKMRSDCGDIRFTDSKAFDSAFWTRNFSYNLVSGCNSASTRFDIEVPSGVTSFYAYYGNPSVTSISNASVLGFTYRKPITINNTLNSNTLTDYQVLVTINTQNLISQGKMRNDCGDIRFTDSDRITLLNYWIESGCNSTNTKIWVKVPNIPANSNKIIYLYYGNPSATSLSEMWYNIKHLNIYNGVFNYNASLGVNGYYSREMQHRLGVAAGDYHTCVLKSNGNVDCYGNNSFGQANDYLGGDAIGVAAGDYHTCVLKSNGNVDCYGDNFYAKANDYLGGDAIGVAAGKDHTCVLKSNGNVVCYGRNSDEQANDYTGGDAIGVAAGGYHTCVLKSNGNVVCYGNNSFGQANDYLGGDAIGVAAGDYHTCVLKSNGNVVCYGRNSDGQANDYTGGDAIGVAAGDYHTCVLKSNGNVVCYGSNSDEQANDYTGGDAKNPFRKYTSPGPTTSIGNEETVIATLGPEETWIRISGGTQNILITGGGGTLKIK